MILKELRKEAKKYIEYGTGRRVEIKAPSCLFERDAHFCQLYIWFGDFLFDIALNREYTKAKTYVIERSY